VYFVGTITALSEKRHAPYCSARAIKSLFFKYCVLFAVLFKKLFEAIAL